MQKVCTVARHISPSTGPVSWSLTNAYKSWSVPIGKKKIEKYSQDNVGKVRKVRTEKWEIMDSNESVESGK